MKYLLYVLVFFNLSMLHAQDVSYWTIATQEGWKQLYNYSNYNDPQKKVEVVQYFRDLEKGKGNYFQAKYCLITSEEKVINSNTNCKYLFNGAYIDLDSFILLIKEIKKLNHTRSQAISFSLAVITIASGTAVYGGVTSIIEESVKRLLKKTILKVLPGGILTLTGIAADIWANILITESICSSPEIPTSCPTENGNLTLEKISVLEYVSVIESLFSHLSNTAGRKTYTKYGMQYTLEVIKENNKTRIKISNIEPANIEERSFYRFGEF